MKTRLRWKWVLIFVVAVVAAGLMAPDASAQQRGGGRGIAGMVRNLCDVDGLWAAATFEAKLDTATLEKLKPVCQKAFDARAKELAPSEAGDPGERFAKVKELGDTLVKEAKEALGADAAKLETWFSRREERVRELEERMGRPGPQPQPIPGTPAPDAPSNPGAVQPAAPAPAPAAEPKKEEEREG